MSVQCIRGFCKSHLGNHCRPLQPNHPAQKYTYIYIYMLIKMILIYDFSPFVAEELERTRFFQGEF